MPPQLLQFPKIDIADVPRGLREIADQIEAGDFGGAHNLAWVIDCGDGKVEVGMLGRAGEPGAVAHFLFSLGQQKLLGAVIDT